MSLASQVSIHFNPTSDNADEIKERVDAIFMGFEALGLIDTSDTGNAAANTTQPGATATGNAPKVDSTGLPWDARIHSTPASINKGTSKWRAKKGVAADLVAQVEAELRARAAGGGVTTQQQPQQPVMGGMNPGAAAAQAVTTGGLPQMPAPGGLPQMPAPTIQQPNYYQDLLGILGPRMNTPENPTGNLTDAWISQCLGMLQVEPAALQTVAGLPADRQKFVLDQFKATLQIA